MRRAALVVALLAVTAGCNGLGGGGGGPTPTVTPVPVPSDTPTADDSSGVAPGLNGAGVIDVDRLAAAHRDAVLNTSYTWSERIVIRSTLGNSTATPGRNHTIYYENATTYHRITSREIRRISSRRRVFPGYTRYANGSMMFTRWVSNQGAGLQYARQPALPAGHRFASIASSAFREYVGEGEARVEVVLVDGQRHFAVTVTEDRIVGVNASSYRARAIVAPNGFVRSLNVTYVGTANNRQVEGHYSFVYTDVGSTTVEPPEWLPEARERVNGTGSFP